MLGQMASQNLHDSKKVATEDMELHKTVAELKGSGLLELETQFFNREELGKFLIDQQGKIKAGQVTTFDQRVVLDKALTEILGRSIFY